MARPYLIIGGTGRTGRTIVTKLRARELPVHVLSRHASQHAQDLPNVELIDGSITETQTSTSALEGAGGVVIAVEPDYQTDGQNGARALLEEGVRNVVDAVKEQDYDCHIVLVSSIYTTHPENMPGMADLIRARARGEDILRTAQLPYTIVRPSWLTDAPGGEQGVRLKQGDQGDGQESREDVAEACVQVLLEPKTQGLVFELYNEASPAPSLGLNCSDH